MVKAKVGVGITVESRGVQIEQVLFIVYHQTSLRQVTRNRARGRPDAFFFSTAWTHRVLKTEKATAFCEEHSNLCDEEPITAVCNNVRCPASGAANVRPKKNIGASMTNMRPCDPDMMLCAGDKLRSKLQGKGISIEVALEKLETCLHIPRNHVKQFRSTFLQISTIASRNHIEQSISTVVYATLVHRWLQ